MLDRIFPPRMGQGFRWLAGSSWISNLGDGFALSAGPLLVASQTRNATLVGLAMLLQRLPWLLFSLVSGVVADRMNRAVLAAGVEVIRAGVLAVLVVSILTHWVSIAVVLIALFWIGVAEVFSGTATMSMLPALVDRDDLILANSRSQTGLIVFQQLIGPAVGSLLFAAGMALPFIGQAVLVGAGAIMLTRIRLPARAEPPTQSRVWAEVVEGCRWTWHHAGVRTLLLTIFIFNVTFGAAWSVLVLYAQERLHLGDAGYGLLAVAGALGGVAGNLSYTRLIRHVSLGNIMRVGLLIETATHFGLALTTSPVVAIAIMAVFGAHAFIWGATSSTIRQRAVPEHLQGRVSSVYFLGVFGGLVIGSAVAGPIADATSITGPFWFAGIGSAVFVVAIWRQLRHLTHEDQPVAA